MVLGYSISSNRRVVYEYSTVHQTDNWRYSRGQGQSKVNIWSRQVKEADKDIPFGKQVLWNPVKALNIT